MAIGMGVAPMGNSSFGFGIPDSILGPNSKLLISSNDGQAKTTRNLDPLTGQYKIDSLGRVEGTDTVPQLVMLRAKTVRGSSTIANFGQSFTSIDRIKDNIVAQVTNAVNVAMDDLVKGNLITINSVTVERFGMSGAIIVMKWTDLTTKLEQKTSF